VTDRRHIESIQKMIKKIPFEEFFEYLFMFIPPTDY